MSSEFQPRRTFKFRIPLRASLALNCNLDTPKKQTKSLLFERHLSLCQDIAPVLFGMILFCRKECPGKILHGWSNAC